MTIKTLIKCALGSLLICLITAALAENWQYSVIIDAGSSGSRMHLFRYHLDTNLPANHLPTIEDVPVTPNKTNKALSTFDQDPATVETSLDSLFSVAITTLNAQGVDPKTVPVEILGTAGMRLLSTERQQAIYTTITDHLKKQYSFTSITAKTISGKEEGIYDWLDVNYLANNFTDSNPTVGIIDVGGASTEIVFSTKEAQADQAIMLIINGQKYTLYSSSILGLGQDEARNTINKDMTSASCYPAGYKVSAVNNYFNLNACDILYSKVLNNALQQKDKPFISEQQKFIAFGSVYYAFKFFAPAQTLSQISQSSNKKMLEDNINTICSTTWPALKEQYPADIYLANQCANGVYIDELLFGKRGYSLQDSQIQVSNTINQVAIDWPLGALLDQIIEAQQNNKS